MSEQGEAMDQDCSFLNHSFVCFKFGSITIPVLGIRAWDSAVPPPLFLSSCCLFSSIPEPYGELYLLGQPWKFTHDVLHPSSKYILLALGLRRSSDSESYGREELKGCQKSQGHPSPDKGKLFGLCLRNVI